MREWKEEGGYEITAGGMGWRERSGGRKGKDTAMKKEQEREKEREIKSEEEEGTHFSTELAELKERVG